MTDALAKVSEHPLLAAHLASADAVGNVPATGGIGVLLGGCEDVSVGIEIDAGFGVGPGPREIR